MKDVDAMITVENNAREALAMATELFAIAKAKGDVPIAAARQRQVRYWTQFIKELESSDDESGINCATKA